MHPKNDSQTENFSDHAYLVQLCCKSEGELVKSFFEVEGFL